MGHSYCSSLFHCVFSTKNRRPDLAAPIRKRLFPYLGGIANENTFKVLSSGGVENHVHLLLSLPASLPVSKALQLLKGGSSTWMHDTFPELRHFAWQEGYGAFSIAISGVNDTIAYIQNQEHGHHKKTFEEELIAFLKRHGIPYDERYVFD